MERIKKALKRDIWILLLDIVAVNLAYYLALAFRVAVNNMGGIFGSPSDVPVYFSAFYRIAPIYTVLCIIVFFLFKLYGGVWRFAGINDMYRILASWVVTTLIQILVSYLMMKTIGFTRSRMPGTYYMLGCMLQLLFVTAIRFGPKTVADEKRRRAKKADKALVVGAGELGQQTVKLLQSGVNYDVSFIVDTEDEHVGLPLDGEVMNYNAFDRHLPTYSKGNDYLTGVMPELLKAGLDEQEKLEIAYNCKEGILAEFGEIRRNFECTLNSNHKGFVDFVLYEAVDSYNANADGIKDETYGKLKTCLIMEKVGQYPSMADMQLFDIEKYKTALSSEKFREFKMALGLYAAGVGCGSFVYLRRIFEDLVKEAANEMSNKSGWDDNKFREFDFNRKIEYLEAFGKKVMPDDLKDIRKKIFGTLSRGVHESSDQDCIELFPVMKFIIEELLDHKLASKERERKLKELTKVLP